MNAKMPIECLYVLWLDQLVQRKDTPAHVPSPFSTGEHISRPVARPVKSTGRPTIWRARPYRALVSWASPSMAHGRGRANLLENLMARAGPGRAFLKMQCAGPGCGLSPESLMSRAGPRSTSRQNDGSVQPRAGPSEPAHERPWYDS